MTETFFLPERDQKLILAYQLTLLLQINLYRIKGVIKGKPLRPIKNRHRLLLVPVGYDGSLNTGVRSTLLGPIVCLFFLIKGILDC